jgi:hypothetical protein
MSDDGKEGDAPPHVEVASRYPFISAALEAARAAIAAGASPTEVRAAALAVAVEAPVEVRAAVLELAPEDVRLHRWDVNESKEPWAAMACVALGLNHGFENFMLDDLGGRKLFQVFDSGIDQSIFRNQLMRIREEDIKALNGLLLLGKSLIQVAEECTKPVFSRVRAKGDLQLVEYLIYAGALRGVDVGSTIVAKAFVDTTAEANELLNNPNPKSVLYDRQLAGKKLVNLRDNVWHAIEQVHLVDTGQIPPVLSFLDLAGYPVLHPDLDLSILKGYEWNSATMKNRQDYEDTVRRDRALKDRITIQAALNVSEKLYVNDNEWIITLRAAYEQLSRIEPDKTDLHWKVAEKIVRKARFHDALLAAGLALGPERFLQLGWSCSACRTQNDPTMTTCSACINKAPKGAETIPFKAMRGLTKYDTRELIAHQAGLVLERLNILPLAYAAAAHVAVAAAAPAARRLDECPVCAEVLDGNSPQVRTPCGHYFHTECIQAWLRGHNTCPISREPLTIAQLTPANERIYQGAKKRKSKRGIKKTRGKKRGRKHRRSRK